MQKISIQIPNQLDYKDIQGKNQNKNIISQAKLNSLSGLSSDVVSFKGASQNQQTSHSSRSAIEVIVDFIKQAFVILQELVNNLQKIFSNKTPENKTADVKESDKPVDKAENKSVKKDEPAVKPAVKETNEIKETAKKASVLLLPAHEEPKQLQPKKTKADELLEQKLKSTMSDEAKTQEAKIEKTADGVKETVKKAPVLLLPAHEEPKQPQPKKTKADELLEQKAKSIKSDETKTQEAKIEKTADGVKETVKKAPVLLLPAHEEPKQLQPKKTKVDELLEQKVKSIKSDDVKAKEEVSETEEKINPAEVLPVNTAADKKEVSAPEILDKKQQEPTEKVVITENLTKANEEAQKAQEADKISESKIIDNSIQQEAQEPFIAPETISKINSAAADSAAFEDEVHNRANYTNGYFTFDNDEEVKDSSMVRKLDFRFFDGGQMKYSKTEDAKTGTQTYTWYKQNGDLLGIETKRKDGSSSYMTFQDKEGKIPNEEFITLSNEKHQYLKYNQDGLLVKKADLEEDNTTVIKVEHYYYKPNSEALDKVRTKFADNLSQTVWYDDKGDVEIAQFEKDNRVGKILWYYEGGKKVKQTDVYLKNGGIEITAYDKSGRVTASQIIKPDKTTIQETTKYYYKNNGKVSFAISEYANGQKNQVWYDDNEIPSISVEFQEGYKTKAIWLYEDGESPKTEELYTKDGRKEVVNFDESGRWTTYTEYPSTESNQYSKTTKFYYKADSETPYYSVSNYSDGKVEKNWFDENENMTARQTEINGAVSKIEKFHEDGLTLKAIRAFGRDGKFEDKHFPKIA